MEGRSVDVEEVLRGGNEPHEEFDQKLYEIGMKALAPILTEPKSPRNILHRAERILSGNDGQVELPAAAAKAMAEAGLLKPYQLYSTDNLPTEGWIQTGESKATRPGEKDWSGVWKEYTVEVPDVETPISVEVRLRAADARGTLQPNFNRWILSRGPLGSHVQVNRA